MSDEGKRVDVGYTDVSGLSNVDVDGLVIKLADNTNNGGDVDSEEGYQRIQWSIELLHIWAVKWQVAFNASGTCPHRQFMQCLSALTSLSSTYIDGSSLPSSTTDCQPKALTT